MKNETHEKKITEFHEKDKAARREKEGKSFKSSQINKARQDGSVVVFPPFGT